MPRCKKVFKDAWNGLLQSVAGVEIVNLLNILRPEYTNSIHQSKVYNAKRSTKYTCWKSIRIILDTSSINYTVSIKIIQWYGLK